MWPRIIRALLCAATTRAAAATSHVVDDFNTTEGMFTLTSQVPPVSTTEVTETSDGVRLDYSSHHLEMYSGFPYAGRLLGDGTYPCAEASYLKLEYRILQAPARPGVARLVMAVGDASECGLDAPLVADPAGDWRGHGGDSFGFASLVMRSDLHNASFAAVANTCNLPEINTAALKKFNADLEARAAATEAPTTAQTMEPTAAPESDAAGRPAVGAVAVALLALVV